MESSPLVLTDPNLLAEFVRESEFKTILEKRFAAPPDLAALLFRDGAFIDAYKGTQFSFGGLWENMKGMIGGSHHYAIMLADLKPFQVQFPVKGISTDKVEISGVATLELQLNPEKPGNILGLMGGVARNESTASASGGAPAGRKALSRFDVVSRFEPQFQDRVFETVIRHHTAEEIRGNRGLQDQLQKDLMLEGERIAGDIGLLIRNASVTWAMNEVEREQFAQAQIARQQEALDYQLGLLKREVARQTEATEVKIGASTDVAKLQKASEDELNLMLLNSEVTFIDAREAAARRQELEALQHEIDVLAKERVAKFANELQDIGHSVDVTKEQLRLRQHQLEIDKLNLEYGHFARKAELDIQKLELEQNRDQTRQDADMAAENLRRMNEIEGDKADRDTDRDLKVKAADTDSQVKLQETEARARVDQMLAAKDLSAEQLDALMAGISPDAAMAAVERAKASGANTAQIMEYLERITNQSREHEHRILETGMKGATGVAAGAGGGAAALIDGGLSSDFIECPSCTKVLPAKAKFCGGCGHQIRT